MQIRKKSQKTGVSWWLFAEKSRKIVLRPLIQKSVRLQNGIVENRFEDLMRKPDGTR
jgi:hypothetical protein